jgi:hypothetical protein
MRSRTLLMTGGLAALLASVTACGPKSTAAGAPTGAASSAQAAASIAASQTAPAAATGAGTSAATAAGGSAGGGSAGGGTTDVCALMSAAQASAINDVTYGATKAQHVTAGYDICQYANTGTHADPVDIQQLTVEVITLSGCYEQLRSTDGPGTNVPGIGDAAFGYQIGVVVKDGDRCVGVSGLTHAELQNDYSHDVAMAKIIMAALH